MTDFEKQFVRLDGKRRFLTTWDQGSIAPEMNCSGCYDIVVSLMEIPDSLKLTNRGNYEDCYGLKWSTGDIVWCGKDGFRMVACIHDYGQPQFVNIFRVAR